MKKTILFVTLTALACSKDKSTPSNEACYICTHAVTVTVSNAGTTTSTTTTACNLTPDEINNIQTSGTHTEVSGSTTTATVTTCVKQ